MPPRPRLCVCQHCGKNFNGTTSFKFCGSGCYHGSRRARTERKCKVCGVTFYKKSQGHHGLPVYCGMRCQTLGRTTLLTVSCVECGKLTRRKPSQLRYKRPFCSKECHYKNKTDPRDVECLKCRAIFQVAKGREATAKFCSRLCKTHYTITGETEIERRVRQALVSMGIPFRQEFPAGNRYSVDFFLPDMQVALEVDGEYWHSRPQDIAKDIRRDDYLRGKGIETVRIKSGEIFGHPNVVQLVRDKLSI